MGFIDINRLKHENVVSSEDFIPRSQRFMADKQIRNSKKSAPKPKPKEESPKKTVENILNKGIEFKGDLMNKLVHFVKSHEHVEFYTTTINNFYKELNVMNNLNKISEKNKLLIKWEKIFIERQKLYKKYLFDQQEKERRKRKEENINKIIEQQIEEKKIYNLKQEKQFEEELEKIRIKG